MGDELDARDGPRNAADRRLAEWCMSREAIVIDPLVCGHARVSRDESPEHRERSSAWGALSRAFARP